jgi:hypothetical protein
MTSVAGHVENVPADIAEQLAVERARYLEDLFAVRTVQLNSYAQNSQLLAELELATSKPKRYLSTAPTNVRYGYRLARALNTAYKAIGWPSVNREPAQSHLQTASDVLDDLLGELRPTLHTLVHESNTSECRDLARQLKDEGSSLEKYLNSEGLGLFLWLPERFKPGGSKSQRDYQLHLVGSSVYSHRSYWSHRRSPIDVNAYSEGAQAKAVFLGQPVYQAATSTQTPRLWQSDVGIPLWVTAKQDGSPVMLGSIVLASDRPLNPASPGDGLAAVGYLDRTRRAAFDQYIVDRAADLLGS